ncbi:hypothetical protein PAAG_00651 [Paracoccidioides lutzii Pb01]|uniref:Uncharacterized protein n=1 Tax=Paracoccidioides lutzii (strain ATCC MYA-826 / Pb01) TaxID=502779 RepID=C1GQ56_PARBA|nr:hypothetical protein PAAG_00651 [Paracoccidioides lutzii Pb01]EEH37730.2 hypothetical protein PAAG_00651 [Paracoccidioides lutzii Pb01]
MEEYSGRFASMRESRMNHSGSAGSHACWAVIRNALISSIITGIVDFVRRSFGQLDVVFHSLIFPKEILNYLDHAREFWSFLVDHNPVAMKRIDQDTVETLQLMAPGASRVDAKTAYEYILSSQAFAGVSEASYGSSGPE